MRNALLVIAIAVFAGLGYYFLRSEPTSATSEPDRTATAAQADADRSAADTVATGTEAGGRTALESTAAAPAPTEVGTTWTGRVVFPPGMPDDEVCTVRVSWAARDWRRAVERQERAEVADQWTDAERAAIEEEPFNDARQQVPVAADGRFAFTLPKGVERAWLEASGRYLYMDAAALRDVAQGIELRPRLGAWMTVDVAFTPGPGVDPKRFAVATSTDYAAPLRPMNMPRLVAEPRRARAAEVADGHARFELHGLACDSTYGLRVEAEPFPIEHLGALGLTPGAHLVRAVELSPGAGLAGRVVDVQGEPIAEATVRVDPGTQFDFNMRNRFRAEQSEEDGSFRILGVPAGPASVKVTAAGARPHEEPITLAVGEVTEGLTFVLKRGATIAGTVYLAGAPVEGVAVTLYDDPSSMTPTMGPGFVPTRAADETDADGRFTLAGLGKGPYVIEASKGEQPWFFARIADVRPGDGDVELELAETPVLHGRVVTTAGEPVEWFRIDVAPTSIGGIMVGLLESQTFHSPDGTWRMPGVGTGQWNLYFEAPDFAKRGPIAANRPGDGDEELVIELQRGATLAGFVRDELGVPQAGATVVHQIETGDMLLDMVGAGPKIETLTEADGSFVLPHLVPGTVSVTAHKQGFTESDPQVFELEEGELKEGVVFVVNSGGAIDGLILDDDRAPVANMLVQIQEMGLADQIFLRSKADGSFYVDKLVPGTWQVIGVPETYQTGATGAAALEGLKMQSVKVVAGEVTEVTLGAPAENPVHIEGRIVPAEGLENSMVIFFPEGVSAFGSMIVAAVDADGRFEADLLFPGRYVVTVNRGEGMGQDSVEFLREIPDQDTVELRLDMPGGAIHGRVTDSKGAPIANVRVSLYGDGGLSTGTIGGGKYTEASTGSDGSYTIQWLAAGSYTVGAGGRPLVNLADSDSPFGREVRHGITLGAGEMKYGVDFELEPAGGIAGKVVHADGSPAVNASVFVRDANGQLLERISLIATGAQGSFTYPGISPGRYTVSARLADQASANAVTIDVAAGKTPKVELQLEPGTMLEVSVVDSEYEPLAADLVVLDSDGHDVAGLFGLGDLQAMLNDEFSTTVRRIGPLPPGKYQVIGRANGLEDKKPVTLKGQTVRKVKLRIK